MKTLYGFLVVLMLAAPTVAQEVVSTIAFTFHASASGIGRAIKIDPGAATTDSDIFVVNVDDLVGAP